jgi:ABC-type branched-subunit amino acid transport system permease subunit
MFLRARERARQSPQLRSRHMLSGAIAAVLGAVMAFWLPHRVPETSGSPASLVLILLLWILGGGLLFLGVASLLGAAMASPPSAR